MEYRGNKEEYQYLRLLKDLMIYGNHREGRNGGVSSLFGAQMRFDLAKGFPLLTTKKTHLKSIIVELLWFLRGDTNVKFLHDHGVTIWDEWADEKGELGPVYGRQWRAWETPVDMENGATSIRFVDQISDVIQSLKEDPFGRRHLVVAWNPGVVDEQALPPCHCLFQFFVRQDREGVRHLDCQLYQRSADVFLGVPFNIASYALLTMMVAQAVGMKPGHFIHTLGDYHLYDNHQTQALEQVERLARPFPTMSLAKRGSIFDYQLGDFTLRDYDPHPAIPAPVSK